MMLHGQAGWALRISRLMAYQIVAVTICRMSSVACHYTNITGCHWQVQRMQTDRTPRKRNIVLCDVFCWDFFPVVTSSQTLYLTCYIISSF